MTELSVDYEYRQLDLCWLDRWLEHPKFPVFRSGGYYHGLIALQALAKPYVYEEHNPYLAEVYEQNDKETRDP